MYKNVIFDIGGVMVDFDPKDFLLERFCNAAVEEKVYRLTFGSETWQKLDAGLCSRYEGSQAMLAAARAEGCAFEVQEVLENWTSILRIRRRMVELVRRLKNHGYCVYYLSNIPEDILPLLMRRGLEGVFDGGVASCDVHINKPDPRIYQCLLDKYGLTAGECIFIDDSRANVQTAFQLGMNSIQMRDSVDTLVRSLATCNVTLR
ncbi:MAG TPA: HAD family phosphatase [Candidatus Faecalibacterium intestinigallinarum]|uniref:HAD family phosphatase n=1 Tax=Candidatus Faecalibacterium intestinigallinarum TaxID=2838581 RepID=A0A9D1Q8J8_9FIRM|nr:HAD family phosphatase [Candidatus Faecalibacterium intestinigallinarum]